MAFHTGRLIDHVHLRAHDFDKTLKFYKAVFAVLGIPITASGKDWFQADELFVDQTPGDILPSHIHFAFQAHNRAMVDAFYEAALAAGGEDNGPPGERDYHPGYYAAFVTDPDGNNIEAVFHGPSKRSAASVVIEPTP
jgi:catechol 2,3-dioxygenase-like lactoylglutathione lyase family enzyme